jgi:hypothetical protein
MCFETQCQKCQKSTWQGCGFHLESIFINMPLEKRCFCGYTEKELELEKSKNTKLGPLPKRDGYKIKN